MEGSPPPDFLQSPEPIFMQTPSAHMAAQGANERSSGARPTATSQLQFKAAPATRTADAMMNQVRRPNEKVFVHGKVAVSLLVDWVLACIARVPKALRGAPPAREALLPSSSR